jgi:uncharacterized protein YpuA (DUF1002 family)
MLGAILKLIIGKKMSTEMGKIAADLKQSDPGLEVEFKKVQQDIKQLESNMDWYCKAHPNSALCKKRQAIVYKLKK